MATKKINLVLRNPYYECGDKIIQLENAARQLKDNKLKNLVSDLENKLREIRIHIDETYIWD